MEIKKLGFIKLNKRFSPGEQICFVCYKQDDMALAVNIRTGVFVGIYEYDEWVELSYEHFMNFIRF